MLVLPTTHRIQLTPIKSLTKPQQVLSISQKKFHLSQQKQKEEPFVRRTRITDGSNQGHKQAEMRFVGNLVGSKQEARSQEKVRIQKVAKQKRKIAEKEQKMK